MNDRKIVQFFFDRSEEAIPALDRQYGRACRGLSRRILRDERDAEECVNDSYLAAWNAIPPAKPSPLLSYILRIVRNLSLKRREKNRAVKRDTSYDAALEELGPCLSSPDSAETELEAKELAEYIRSFLAAQTKENRVIFLRRYWFADPIAEIARRTGLREGAVSTRLSRLRSDLRQTLLKEEIL